MSLEKLREAEGPATVTGKQDKEGLHQRELASQWGTDGRTGPPSTVVSASARSCPEVGQAKSEASAFLPAGTGKPVMGVLSQQPSR